MYKLQAHNRYQSVQFTTIDRGRLLLMMYDGCLKFLRLAKEGLENKNIPQFARFLSKSQAVIGELMSTLDFEKGGDIARDLDRLYDFMLYYLTEANIEKNPAKVGRVIRLVETISSAYREVIESGKADRELAGLQDAKSQIQNARNEESRQSSEPADYPRVRVSY